MIEPLFLVYSVNIVLGLASFYLAWKLYRLHRGGLRQSAFAWVLAAGALFALHALADAVSEALGIHSELAESVGHAVVLLFLILGLRKLLGVWKE